MLGSEVTYLRRLPRALALLTLFCCGYALLGVLLLVNGFYFLLTSASTREAFDRMQAVSDRVVRGRR